MTEVEKLNKAYLKLEKENEIGKIENKKNAERNVVLQEDLKNTRFTLGESVLDLNVKKTATKVMQTKYDKLLKDFATVEKMVRDQGKTLESRDEKISAMKEQIEARDAKNVIQAKAIEAFELADKKSTEQIAALQATIKINKVKYDKVVKSIPKHLAKGCEVEPGVRVYGSEIAIQKCSDLMKAGRE